MADKVLLILVDGMRPDAVAALNDKAVNDFIAGGAYAADARTTWPSVTLPCHMSLFHSVEPERHGVFTNTYVPQNHPVKGLFEVVSDAELSSAVFYCWEPLRDLWRPGNVGYTEFLSWGKHEFTDVDARLTQTCIKHMAEYKPDFAFLYLGETDEYGHEYGWMSEQYMDCVRRAWKCIMDVSATLGDEYTVMVTADHGGHARNHGDTCDEDMYIPLLMRGRRFTPGSRLDNANIKDIAPTVTDILGIRPERVWEGRSLAEK